MVADATASHVPSKMDAKPVSFGDFKILNQFLPKIVDCTDTHTHLFCGGLGASPIKLWLKTCFQDFRAGIWAKMTVRIYRKWPFGCSHQVDLNLELVDSYEDENMTKVQGQTKSCPQRKDWTFFSSKSITFGTILADTWILWWPSSWKATVSKVRFSEFCHGRAYW